MKGLGRSEPNLEKLTPALLTWERATRRAFLEAYGKSIAGSGIYPSMDDMRGVLHLAEMEKVLYELRYEVNNRPDWIHIPLAGLLRLRSTLHA